MKITRLPRPADTRPRSWHPHFVWFRILRIEQEHSFKPIWGVVVLDMMERRYSSSRGRWLWRDAT